MTGDQVSQTIEAFILLREYYEQPPLENPLLKAYADDVQDLPYESVRDVMRRMRRDPKRSKAPRPAELRAYVKPEVVSRDTEAQEIAGRIGKAITRFGYMQTAKAREFIGEIGWRICEERGGWRHLCSSLEASHMNAFHAQCRDAAKAKLELGMRDEYKPPAPALPAPQQRTGARSMPPVPISQLLASYVDSGKARR